MDLDQNVLSSGSNFGLSLMKNDGLNPNFGLNPQHPGTREYNSSPRVLSQKSAHSKGKNPKALAWKKRARAVQGNLPSIPSTSLSWVQLLWRKSRNWKKIVL